MNGFNTRVKLWDKKKKQMLPSAPLYKCNFHDCDTSKYIIHFSTGLKDNGKYIYDGDIAHIIEAGDYGGEFYGAIEFLDTWAIYGIVCTSIKEISKSKTNTRVDTIFTHGFLTRHHGSCIELSKAINFEKFEIVGNIHENPELLRWKP